MRDKSGGPPPELMVAGEESAKREAERRSEKLNQIVSLFREASDAAADLFEFAERKGVRVESRSARLYEALRRWRDFSVTEAGIDLGEFIDALDAEQRDQE